MSQQSAGERPADDPTPPVESAPTVNPPAAVARITGKVGNAITSRQGQRLLTLALFLLGPPLQLWLMGLAGIDQEDAKTVASWWMEIARNGIPGQ